MMYQLSLDDVFGLVDVSASSKPTVRLDKLVDEYVPDDLGVICDIDSNIGVELIDRVVTCLALCYVGIPAHIVFNSFVASSGVVIDVSDYSGTNNDSDIIFTIEALSTSAHIEAKTSPNKSTIIAVRAMLVRMINALSLNSEQTRKDYDVADFNNGLSHQINDIYMIRDIYNISGRYSFFTGLTSDVSDGYDNAFIKTLTHFLMYLDIDNMATFKIHVAFNGVFEGSYIRNICIFNPRTGTFNIFELEDITDDDIELALVCKRKFD